MVILMNEKDRCAHCGSKKIKKVDSVFMEDVNHDIFQCDECGEFTISHLYWETISQSDKKEVMKRKPKKIA